MRERAKTMLLAALMLLTVYLTLRVWIQDAALLDSPSMAWAAPLRWILGLDATPLPDSGPAPALVSPCAWPSVVAVSSGGARLGAAYGVHETDALALSVRDLLREALSTATTPVAVTRDKWLEALRGDCVYMEYELALPLGVLAAWASGSCTIEAEVRALAVCVSGGSAELWYREETSGGYFQAATGAAPVIPDISGAGARPCRFCFERPESFPGAPDTTLIFEDQSDPPLVTAADADATLFCAPFLRQVQIADNNWYDEPEGRVYVDSLRTCRVYRSGLITYSNPEADSDRAGVALEELEKARIMLSGLSRALGDSRWALSGMDGGVYSFTAQVDGIPVTGGARATLVFGAGELVSAEIWLRQYSVSGEIPALLPVRQALELLPPGASGLGLCYPDTGGELTAQWVAKR